MDTDRNLLFGVLALQADLIDKTQFADACGAWTARKDTPLAILLLERGWITPEDKSDVERLLERKLKKHGGNAGASLAAAADAEVEAALAVFKDSDIQQSLAGLSRHAAMTLESTLVPSSGMRQRYALLHLHATGGIGQVWLARDGELGREVALKELRPERADDAALCDRFLKEARITGQLEHPGIVPVYELARGPDRDHPFYTMRFVKGRTLTEAIRAWHGRPEATPLEQRALLNAFVGVCNTVAYAHARGVVHRDLKGANVLLGDFGEVIVFDWGLAKVLGKPAEGDAVPVALNGEGRGDETRHGLVMGTPAYMPPEQARGEIARIDHRSDVYSLGAVLYEILTNRPPFTADSTANVLRKVCDEEPERPSRLVAGVPPALEAVCLKALAKEPERRYQSARDLADEVQRWLADEPVQAHRDSLPVRLSRWARRHRTLVTGLAALVGTALVALTAATVLINRQKDRAVKAEEEAVTNATRADGYALRYHNVMDLTLENLVQTLSEKAGLQSSWVVAFDASAPRGPKVAPPKIDLDPGNKAFLEKTLAALQQILDDQGADPVVRKEAGRTAARVGDIHRLLGLHDKAEQAYRLADERFHEAAKAAAPSPEDVTEQARALNQWGRTLGERGKNEEAADKHRQARSLLDPFAADVRAHPRPCYELANVHVNRGIAAQRLQRVEEAIAAYREGDVLFDRLRQAFPDVPEYREGTARARANLGMALLAADKRKDAETAFQESFDLLEGLINQFAARADLKQEYVIAGINLAGILDLAGKKAESRALDRKILPVAEKLATDFPDQPDFQQKLAGLYYNLGNSLAKDGKLKEALPEMEKAVAAGTKLIKTRANVPDYQADLARSLNDYATALAHSFPPRFEEAEKTWQRVESLYDGLARQRPAVPDYRRRQAAVFFSLGVLRTMTGRVAEAEPFFRKALALQEKLVAELTGTPATPLQKNALAGCNYELGKSTFNLAGILSQRWQAVARTGPVVGTTLGGLGGYWLGEEQNFLERGLHHQLEALAANLGHPEYRQGVLLHFGGLVEVGMLQGDHAAVARRAERLAEIFPTEAEQRYNAATYLALSAAGARADVRLREAERTNLSRRYGDQAVQRLREAAARGFKDVARLRNDPNLNPIRERDDFRTLLAEMESKTNPNSPK